MPLTRKGGSLLALAGAAIHAARSAGCCWRCSHWLCPEQGGARLLAPPGALPAAASSCRYRPLLLLLATTTVIPRRAVFLRAGAGMWVLRCWWCCLLLLGVPPSSEGLPAVGLLLHCGLCGMQGPCNCPGCCCRSQQRRQIGVRCRHNGKSLRCQHIAQVLVWVQCTQPFVSLFHCRQTREQHKWYGSRSVPETS